MAPRALLVTAPSHALLSCHRVAVEMGLPVCQGELVPGSG